jgi:hypothetical protein
MILPTQPIKPNSYSCSPQRLLRLLLDHETAAKVAIVALATAWQNDIVKHEPFAQPPCCAQLAYTFWLRQIWWTQRVLAACAQYSNGKGLMFNNRMFPSHCPRHKHNCLIALLLTTSLHLQRRHDALPAEV